MNSGYYPLVVGHHTIPQTASQQPPFYFGGSQVPSILHAPRVQGRGMIHHHRHHHLIDGKGGVFGKPEDTPSQRRKKKNEEKYANSIKFKPPPMEVTDSSKARNMVEIRKAHNAKIAPSSDESYVEFPDGSRRRVSIKKTRRS